ncbi:MAG: hypothetical protein HYW05_00140 [Candidatus Diapherotrites archaeon]|nr:hypothetical protein [Candidatus Diapherotrites archaeon]
MEIATVFLFVLVIALALGHALLYLTKLRGPGAESPGSGSEIAPPAADAQDEKFPAATSADLSARYKALNEKIKMAHSRLGDLERVLLEVANAKEMKEGKIIESRLQNLDNFKANTAVELKAIKEILGEMREGKNKKGKKGEEADLSREDMHKIIYRSANKKAA